MPARVVQPIRCAHARRSTEPRDTHLHTKTPSFSVSCRPIGNCAAFEPSPGGPRVSRITSIPSCQTASLSASLNISGRDPVLPGVAVWRQIARASVQRTTVGAVWGSMPLPRPQHHHPTPNRSTEHPRTTVSHGTACWLSGCCYRCWLWQRLHGAWRMGRFSRITDRVHVLPSDNPIVRKERAVEASEPSWINSLSMARQCHIDSSVLSSVSHRIGQWTAG